MYQNLRGRDLFSMLHGVEVPTSAPPPSAPQPHGADSDSRNDRESMTELKAASDRQQAQVQKIQDDLRKLQSAVTRPQYAFVKRVRSTVVHIGSTVELSNPPSRWRSKCGWMYGTSNFLRVAEIVTPLRKCKKCFEMGEGSSTDGSSDSDGSAISGTLRPLQMHEVQQNKPRGMCPEMAFFLKAVRKFRLGGGLLRTCFLLLSVGLFHWWFFHSDVKVFL